MFSKITVSIFLFLISGVSIASWIGADSHYSDRSFNERKLRATVIELVNSGFYYSALPWMKEYLIRGTKNLDTKIEKSFSKMIKVVGLKQFETLPHKFLIRSKSDNIRYILAKKYMRAKKYNKALGYLERISNSHSIYPYALNMLGTIYSIKGKQVQANTKFEGCVQASNNRLNIKVERSLVLNRDYCVLGKARSKFAARSYNESDLLYLDIPKNSIVWPEILFEEAWNSYYQKNYNRTLGKLVSYKAPVLAHMFNPEVKVLEALSFLKLCLYTDAKKVSDGFYTKYLKDTRKLRRYLNSNKKKTLYFYELMSQYEKNNRSSNKLTRKLLKQISRGEVFISLKKQLLGAAAEYDQVRNQRTSRLKKAVIKNLQEVLRSQKKILGAHIRSRLISHYANLYKAFEGMSYIKLEVLAQRKAKLYSFDEKKRTRGDIKYIKRNEKQYFWDFNGEFWADELGDYVFALKSKC
jgi:hypothetical protein